MQIASFFLGISQAFPLRTENITNQKPYFSHYKRETLREMERGTGGKEKEKAVKWPTKNSLLNW